MKPMPYEMNARVSCVFHLVCIYFSHSLTLSLFLSLFIIIFFMLLFEGKPRGKHSCAIYNFRFSYSSWCYVYIFKSKLSNFKSNMHITSVCMKKKEANILPSNKRKDGTQTYQIQTAYSTRHKVSQCILMNYTPERRREIKRKSRETHGSPISC